MRKGETSNCNKQFLLFSQCFLPYMVPIFHFKCALKSRLQFVSIWNRLKFCCLLTHSHTMTPFDAPWETSLLRTLWEIAKLLLMSNFSFTHSVSYPFRELPDIFIKFKIVVCRLFQFGPV